MKDKKLKVQHLREEIKKHDLAYAKGFPIITDSEYDNLYMELERLENEFPELYDENSPTQKIYDTVVEGLVKVKHTSPMLSQDKIKDEDGLNKFLLKAQDTIVVQEKLDGLTIVLHYNRGKLAKAVTRGSGYIGEDVTHIMLNTDSVPNKIPFDGKLEVRSEALIPKDTFNTINSKLEANNRYKSARNLASGTVRNLNGVVAKERGLEVIFYDLIQAENKTFKTDIEQLDFLKSLGFPIVEYKVFEHSEKGIQDLKEHIFNYNDNIRPLLKHDIDGLVLKFNKLSIREKLGYTSKFPRWGCAYKFESLDTTTKLLDVVWTVGKNGQLTPNAVLEPCEIDGVTISKASLANHEDIEKRGLKIGDTVLVIRANDVIPKVVSPILEERDGSEKEIEVIKNCPVCHSTLEKDISVNGEEGVHIYCVNTDCPAQLEGKIQHFASRNALNIDGLGNKTVQQLLDKKLISSIQDLYHLHEVKEKLLTLDKFGERKVEKLLNGLEESKKASLKNVLYGLCIRYVGEGGAERIANHFENMDVVMERSKYPVAFHNELKEIEDVGEGTSFSVMSFFMNEQNRSMIQALKSEGFLMATEKKIIIQESPFSGKTFVITGALSKGQKKVKEHLESLGATVASSVTKKTDFLILGEGKNGSSKHKKALELGTKIISEEELYSWEG